MLTVNYSMIQNNLKIIKKMSQFVGQYIIIKTVDQ